MNGTCATGKFMPVISRQSPWHRVASQQIFADQKGALGCRTSNQFETLPIKKDRWSVLVHYLRYNFTIVKFSYQEDLSAYRETHLHGW